MKPQPTRYACPCGNRLQTDFEENLTSVYCKECGKLALAWGLSVVGAAEAFERVYNCKLEEIK